MAINKMKDWWFWYGNITIALIVILVVFSLIIFIQL